MIYKTNLRRFELTVRSSGQSLIQIVGEVIIAGQSGAQADGVNADVKAEVPFQLVPLGLRVRGAADSEYEKGVKLKKGSHQVQLRGTWEDTYHWPK
jgi:hypothetical protein